MDQYEITLNEEQLLIIANCLESVVNVRLGKISANNYPYSDLLVFDSNTTYSKEEIDKIDDLFSEIKKIMFPDLHPNANLGVGHNEKTDHIYEMFKNIMHERQKRRNERQGKSNLFNVHSDTPHKYTNKPDICVRYLSRDIIRDKTIDSILDEEE